METKKERFIKILKRVLIGLSIGLNVIFLIAMIIGGASVKKTNKLNKVDNVSEKVEFKQYIKKLVSYDDTNYKIILTADELNNYTWDNLYALILTYQFENTSPLGPIPGTSSYGEYVDRPLQLIPASETLQINQCISIKCSGSIYVRFNYNDDSFKRWTFSTDGGTTQSNVEYDLTMGFTDVYYADFKTAIELDIQANSGTMTDGIFDTLTESTVSFIGTLGSGIVAMTSVFYDSANSQLTTIGLLSVIVVAVSLSYFLFRLIIGLIRMRG